MRCILCLNDIDDSQRSVEHIIPEAVGGTATTRSVCKKCNSHLGTHVDSHLVDHWYIKAQRMFLGLKGKQGRTPNPFSVSTLVDDPSQIVYYRVQPDGSPGEVHIENKVICETDEKGGRRYKITVDAEREDELPDIVNKILERSGQKPWARQVILSQAKRSRIDHPHVKLDISIDLDRYQRGLLKIAYEVACLAFGATYLYDPVSDRIRRCLLQDDVPAHFLEEFGIRGNCSNYEEESGSSIRRVVELWGANPDEHVVMLCSAGPTLIGAVRIFSVFFGVFHLSEDCRRYGSFSPHCIRFNPINGVVIQQNLQELISERIEDGEIDGLRAFIRKP